MARNYRTAQGKVLDMAALAAKNERTRAVGNMKVNARGDSIDAQGKIIVPVTQKVGERYQKTVGNKSAQVKTPKTSSKVANPKYELTQEELELENSFEDDLEVEKIKAKETKKK
jgi:hypothetical protein